MNLKQMIKFPSTILVRLSPQLNSSLGNGLMKAPNTKITKRLLILLKSTYIKQIKYLLQALGWVGWCWSSSRLDLDVRAIKSAISCCIRPILYLMLSNMKSSIKYIPSSTRPIIMRTKTIFLEA